MPDIVFKKSDIPFWAGGDGTLRLHVNVPDLTKQLPPSNNDLFSLDLNIGGNQLFSIGAFDTVKLGIKASADVNLVPLWPSTPADRLRILDNYGLAGYFDPNVHSDRLLLVLTLGANADVNLSTRFQYSLLTATASLEAGGDASYALIRSYPSTTPAVNLLTDFFKALRLPANVETPLAQDEVIVFEYGGRLNFNAGLAMGYQINGAPSFEIGQLQLAERYRFSVLGSLSLGASVAGRFTVEIRNGSGNGWVRVVVRKSRAESIRVAADVAVSIKLQEEGLPESADDFLGAVIGLNAKNWINMFAQVRKLTDFNKLEAYLDNLAKSFIEEYTGKAFQALADKTQLDEVINKIGRVVDEYNNLGDHAVALFDRYFNVVTNAVDSKLDQALRTIRNATSWGNLKIQADDVLLDVIQHLTDGDPLGWMLGRISLNGQEINSLDEIKNRADKALDLVNNLAHKEIQDFIALAKSQFPLDHFIQQLGHIDWLELKNMADRRLTGFVERLIGQSIEKLSNTELGDAVRKFHKVLDSIEQFKNTFYEKLKDTFNQSFQFQLHAEYSRASERDALVDFELDLTTAKGKELMKRAGHGDFADVLAEYDNGVVKLNQGILTHKVTRQSQFAVNIVGWHTGWHYQGLDRLIIESEQRIQADAGGQLTINTTMDLQKERERKRNGERVYTNFLLRFLGESHGKLEFDKNNQAYLIDVITRMGARYSLVFQDPSTTAQELHQYLSFADDFGLATSDEATEAALEPLLPTDAQGNFGEVSIFYDVRFTEEGLRSLFATPFTMDEEKNLRRVMRLIVLANYLNEGPFMAKRGWCYWTPGIQSIWQTEGLNFTNHSSLEFKPIAPSPLKNLAAPLSVSLDRTGLLQLDTLYRIEESMVKGFRNLSKTLQSAGKLNPHDLEKALGDFGRALTIYDNFDEGENTIFGILDKLIHRDAGNMPYRNSSLTLTSTVNNQKVTKMLIA